MNQKQMHETIKRNMDSLKNELENAFKEMRCPKCGNLGLNVSLESPEKGISRFFPTILIPMVISCPKCNFLYDTIHLLVGLRKPIVHGSLKYNWS